MNTSVALVRSDFTVDTLDSALSQFLTFKLRMDTYAIPLGHVREIIQYRDVTVVPMMPSCVRGVINLRGNVIPVVDLEVRFGHKSREPGQRSVILILEMRVEDEYHIYGVVVDAVSDVMALSADDIRPTPSFGNGLHNEFILGVAKPNGVVMLILAVPKILLFDK